MECLPAPAWSDVIDCLRHLAAQRYVAATDLLEDAIDRDGIGAVNDALADVCRALMDRVVFEPGTIDIHSVVDDIALRIVETSEDTRSEALDRQRSLIVFLGSEGLACAARNDVASWSADDRLRDSIACMIGLLGVVADDERVPVAVVVETLAPPGSTVAPEGTFGLAWRGPNGAEPFAGVVPRGYTAHITFVGEEPCSLRAIFARVALLRDGVAAVEPLTSEVTTLPLHRR
jgi:hypothetical protein